MIKVTHPSGETRLAKLDDTIDRLTLCAAVLTVEEMRRLFTGDDSANVCRALDLPVARSETVNCKALYAHFSGV